MEHVKIVLPCTNEGVWVRITVDSILERTAYPSLEICIVANGDTVTDFSFVETSPYRACVRLIAVRERLGVGKSINCAVTPGDAGYYVFLDAHSLVEDDTWLERAVACLAEHPSASMVQPEVLHFTYEGEIAPNGTLDRSRIVKRDLEYAIRWAWPYEDPWHLADVFDAPAAPEPYEGMAGGGMAVFTQADTFHALGGYDPEVSGWYPETMDYCVRAWLLGRPMLVDPRIRILHRRKTKRDAEDVDFFDRVHGVLRTAYKYLKPRRRDLAEILFRRHGLGPFVDRALERIHQGRWLYERVSHLRERRHDDDWLFSRFAVYEERW